MSCPKRNGVAGGTRPGAQALAWEQQHALFSYLKTCF